MVGKSTLLAKGQKLVFVALVLAMGFTVWPVEGQGRSFVGYRSLEIAGWDVRIQRRLERRNFIVAERVQTEVLRQLSRVEAVVPPHRLEALRSVTVWLSYDNEPGIAYHDNALWLQGKGRDVAMVNGIEIEDARDFLRMAEAQPWLLLHEFTHALHHQQHGWRLADVDAAWLSARRDGALYRDVPHWFDGPPRDAYALTNPREYLAELSEAFFGSNAMYPHTADQLRQYDPAGFQAVWAFWCQPAAEASGAVEETVAACDRRLQ